MYLRRDLFEAGSGETANRLRHWPIAASNFADVLVYRKYFVNTREHVFCLLLLLLIHFNTPTLEQL